MNKNKKNDRRLSRLRSYSTVWEGAKIINTSMSQDSLKNMIYFTSNKSINEDLRVRAYDHYPNKHAKKEIAFSQELLNP